MPFILILIGLLSVYQIGHQYIPNIVLKNTKITPTIQTIQEYTISSIKYSTLSYKYNEDDFWNGNVISFNNCSYKVIDNKKGGRKFEPLNKCPPLIITPISYEKYIAIENEKNNKISNQTSTNNITNKNNLKNNDLTTQTSTTSLVKCLISENCGGGYMMLTSEECKNSVCCQIGNRWEIKKSYLECQIAQSQNYNNNLQKILDEMKNSNSQIPAEKSFVSCTICYPLTNKCDKYDTLFKTEEECKKFQAEINNRFLLNQNQFGNQTIEEKSISDENSSQSEITKTECQENIIRYYNELIRKCEANLRAIGAGNSSEMLRCENLKKERDRQLESCN